MPETVERVWCMKVPPPWSAQPCHSTTGTTALQVLQHTTRRSTARSHYSPHTLGAAARPGTPPAAAAVAAAAAAARGPRPRPLRPRPAPAPARALHVKDLARWRWALASASRASAEALRDLREGRGVSD